MRKSFYELLSKKGYFIILKEDKWHLMNYFNEMDLVHNNFKDALEKAKNIVKWNEKLIKYRIDIFYNDGYGKKRMTLGIVEVNSHEEAEKLGQGKIDVLISENPKIEVFETKIKLQR